jgi:aminoglycoside phosphotransferase (APT) family kinase protein
MIDAIRAETGLGLLFDGPCRGGQVGAAYVRWPDGHRGVLTWRPAVGLAQLRDGPLAVIGALRAIGYPAPAAELTVQAGGAVAQVWELIPGAPVERLTPALFDQALALNVRQAAALAGHRAIPAVNLFLTTDGPGFCLHEPLRGHNARARQLDDWITGVGAAHPGPLDGDDAVHCDFQPANFLADGDQLTGVVDWDGAARGDRRFDLVTLRFGVHVIPAGPGVTECLDRMLDAIAPDVLAPMWAGMSLRMTDWAIRHFAPADVEHWLDLAQQRVG